jgi:hypothetical protein
MNVFILHDFFAFCLFFNNLLLLHLRPAVQVLHSRLYLSLHTIRCIQSIHSHLISVRSILILPSNPCIHLPSGLFTSGFLTSILHALLITPMRATWPAPSHLPWFDHPNIVCEASKLCNSHYAVFFCVPPLPPSYVKIFSSAHCSQTLSNSVFPFVWETKFDAQIKGEITLWFCIF